MDSKLCFDVRKIFFFSDNEWHYSTWLLLLWRVCKCVSETSDALTPVSKNDPFLLNTETQNLNRHSELKSGIQTKEKPYKHKYRMKRKCSPLTLASGYEDQSGWDGRRWSRKTEKIIQTVIHSEEEVCKVGETTVDTDTQQKSVFTFQHLSI